MRDVLIQVEHLQVEFPVSSGGLWKRQSSVIKAVNDVSLTIFRGETLGLVGESGCGKSTTGRAILQLQQPTRGKVYFQGVELTTLSTEALQRLRPKLQIVFQDPYSSLNPKMKVKDIVGEPLEIHQLAQGKEKLRLVEELLEQVGLAKHLLNRYPHEFSGGQRQRIAIARALASQPEFIICDEAIAALDVSIQAQIINLLQDLQASLGLTYLFIAHDLRIVRHISHRVAVMYLGKIVELASCDRLYQQPLHPYTQILLASVPIPDPELEQKREKLQFSGEVSTSINLFQGCQFLARCPFAVADCRQEPPLKQVDVDHWVACHLVS